ncbi:hypothetical protein [Streptomyces sp. NPDC056160]|uniref:hypothetical protein n=1 Tax=Streptomyces sp. NPDC056160 TaxID=3345731 RepID=UPI0035D6BC3B
MEREPRKKAGAGRPPGAAAVVAAGAGVVTWLFPRRPARNAATAFGTAHHGFSMLGAAAAV